jgi:hypothetical protein
MIRGGSADNQTTELTVGVIQVLLYRTVTIPWMCILSHSEPEVIYRRRVLT